MRNHQLARASSLESPKRLRFALGSLERCSEGERVCDAGRVSSAIIPSIRLPPDQVSPGHPRRLNSASPASTISAPSSASCPCIEALRLSPERQPLCWVPSPFSRLVHFCYFFHRHTQNAKFQDSRDLRLRATNLFSKYFIINLVLLFH